MVKQWPLCRKSFRKHTCFFEPSDRKHHPAGVLAQMVNWEPSLHTRHQSPGRPGFEKSGSRGKGLVYTYTGNNTQNNSSINVEVITTNINLGRQLLSSTYEQSARKLCHKQAKSRSHQQACIKRTLHKHSLIKTQTLLNNNRYCVCLETNTVKQKSLHGENIPQ